MALTEVLSKGAGMNLGIVMPAYNAEPWIGATLRSVLECDFPGHLLDVVVIDDGSEDGTVREAKRVLQGTSVSWRVHSCERGGPGRSRNLGASMVRGEWLQFLDADDLLARTKLRNQMSVAVQSGPDVAVVYSSWASLSEDGAPPELRTPVFGAEPLVDLLTAENFIATGSQLVNRAWFERIGGFQETHWLLEDVELLLRLVMAGGKFVRAPGRGPQFYYRRRRRSLSRRNPTGFAEACVRNARMVEQYFKHRREGLSDRQKRVLLDVYGHALRVFFERDRMRFEHLLRHVEELEPGYSPAEPARLKWLSRMIGYRRAEATARAFRQARRWVEDPRLNTLSAK